MKKSGMVIASLMLAGSVAMAADPVYSVNTVGYQKVNVNHGFTLFGNSWNSVGGVDSLPVQTLLSKAGLVGGNDVTDSDVIYVFDNVAGSYVQYYLYFGDNLWYKLGDNDPTTNVITRGDGFWLKHVGAATNTIVSGEVPTEGTNIVNFAVGFTMFSAPYTAGMPINGSTVWTGTAGNDVTDSDVIYLFDNVGGSYIQYYLYFGDNLWYKLGDNDPTTDSIPMGAAAWYKAKGSASVKVIKPY